LGIVPVCANYEPETYVSAWLAAEQGDQELLRRTQQRISAIRDVLLMGEKNWISGIMYGMSTLGIGSGIPVRPLQELGEEDKRLIDNLEIIDVNRLKL
jgi:dihydrodipicolinate synthase/N-acetylneuraminate lyase